MSQKVYQYKNIQIRYFNDAKALFLKPLKNAKKDDFKLLKNKLETLLQIESSKTLPNGVSMKLAQNMTSNVDELVRSMGATGGEEIEDAASVAKKAAEENVEREKQNLSIEPMHQQQQSQMPMQPEQSQMPMESIFSNIFNYLYEGTFIDVPKPKPKFKKKKKTKRIAKYWESLERASGKNRHKIIENDVLALRKKFSIKPPSDQRNEVLRSLDRAFDYFYSKIDREKGPKFAERFSEDYAAVDNLTPGDYSEKPKIKKIDKQKKDSMLPIQGIPQNPINGIDLLDFSEFLDEKEVDEDEENDDEESYEDIDIERI